MQIIPKIAHCLSLLSVLFLTLTLNAVDLIVITAPAASATVSGQPLAITGISSQANFRVRLTLNTTIIGSATTNGSGNWSFSSSNVGNGTHTLTADLIDNDYRILATDSNTFTIQNAETITIATPTEGDNVALNPATVTGSASLPSTTVQLLLDNVLTATTTTDTQGNWQAAYTMSANGAHALLAKLIVSGSPVATTTTNINAKIPVIYPTGKTSERIIKGEIPTTGSGSGAGYTYSVSGSIITINFVPAFTTAPLLIATGVRASGSSTVTVASVSTSAASVSFSTSTQKIYFTASTLQ